MRACPTCSDTSVLYRLCSIRCRAGPSRAIHHPSTSIDRPRSNRLRQLEPRGPLHKMPRALAAHADWQHIQHINTAVPELLGVLNPQAPPLNHRFSCIVGSQLQAPAGIWGTGAAFLAKIERSLEVCARWARQTDTAWTTFEPRGAPWPSLPGRPEDYASRPHPTGPGAILINCYDRHSIHLDVHAERSYRLMTTPEPRLQLKKAAYGAFWLRPTPHAAEQEGSVFLYEHVH